MLLPNAAFDGSLTLRDVESGDPEAIVYRFTFSRRASTARGRSLETTYQSRGSSFQSDNKGIMDSLLGCFKLVELPFGSDPV